VDTYKIGKLFKEEENVYLELGFIDFEEQQQKSF
jgi:hypothetical protein